MSQREREIETLSLALRRRAFKVVLDAGSGHLGGSSSSAELLACLYFGAMRYDPGEPLHPGRDRVLVRGHLGPLRYSLFALLGWVDEAELSTYRSVGSRLQGHESMHLLPGVDMTPSGSLGMLLSYGVGTALALRDQEISATTWVFLGDGEEEEGNVAEAARHAAALGLDNIVCIVDQNGKQLSRPTREVDGVEDLAALWRAYGWDVRVIKDGHAVPEVLRVLKAARVPGRPTAIIAHTLKGYGLEGHQAQPSGYHTLSSCPRSVVSDAMTRLDGELAARGIGPDGVTAIARSLLADIARPPTVVKPRKRLAVRTPPTASTPSYDDALEGYLRALVEAFRDAPEARLYVMTADWITPTVADRSGLRAGHIRFVDVGIREQHLLACAHGIATTDPGAHVLVILGDAFILRASDQLHAMAQAGSRVVVVGTDAGICEARNGATHQSTGQPGALVAMPGLEFLEPADASDLHECLDWALTSAAGPAYVRLHSGEVELLRAGPRNLSAYTAWEPMPPVRLVLVGSGLVVGALVHVARVLGEQGVGARVVSVVSPNRLGEPFRELLVDGVPVFVAYNGNPTVLAAAVAHAILAGNGPRPSRIAERGFTLGTSGTLPDLARHFGLDAPGLMAAISTAFPEVVNG